VNEDDLKEIHRKLDALLEMCVGGSAHERRRTTPGLHLTFEEMDRLERNLHPSAYEPLTGEEQQFLNNYLAGVGELGLTDAQRAVLVDVLVHSKEAVGKWPRLSKLRQRLQSEVEARSYDANAAWVDDAYGWAGQD